MVTRPPQGTVSDPAPQLDQARVQLSRLHAVSGQKLRDLWLQLAQLAALALDVERVGLWVLIDDNRAIRCRYLLQRSSDQVFQGAVLSVRDFPSYFASLDKHRVIVADDAPHAPATSELHDAYLQPLGISSMLDAPIYIGGELVGIVCHEHVGPSRQWLQSEVDFASAVADNIARLYGEHERLNAEETLEGYQRSLMELRRMEAIGRIAAGVAHDFRGIIGAALGFAELIRRTPDLPSHVDRYAQRIVEALDRGRQLTREIMDFGKDEPISPRVLDVPKLLDSLIGMLRVLIGESTHLHVVRRQPISRVFIDPAQLERTILNLVMNAHDAMPAGGDVTIALGDVETEDEDGERATFASIAVTDTGSGMDAATQANVFKPFFTTKGEQGTGLGLVIVEQIITRAGGFARIESRVGVGTTVRIFLPRIASAVL